MGWVVRLTFAHLSMLLPVRRVAETPSVLVFEHPAPSWHPHILLVPKRPVRTFLHFRGDSAALFGEMLGLALATAQRLDLYRTGFALMINGGQYQDVAQAHLHLTGLDSTTVYAAPSSPPDPGLATTPSPDPALVTLDGLLAFQHPRPQRELHLAIVPEDSPVWANLDGDAAERLGRALAGVGQRFVEQSDALPAGYTLLANVTPGGAHDPVCFHLVGGARRLPPDPA